MAQAMGISRGGQTGTAGDLREGGVRRSPATQRTGPQPSAGGRGFSDLGQRRPVAVMATGRRQLRTWGGVAPPAGGQQG